MAVGISVNKTYHRFDTVLPPQFTITGTAATPSNRLIADIQLYKDFSAAESPFLWSPLNRTNDMPFTIRQMNKSTLTLTNINRDAGIVYTNRLYKQAGNGDGFDGGVFANVVSGTVGIEIKPINSNSGTYAVSLQSGVVTQDFQGPNIEHCLILGGSNVGSISEYGVVMDPQFAYADGDRFYLEHRNGIVRYWQIKSDTNVILLRTTRSKLEYPIKPCVLLYHETCNALVTLFLGDEASINLKVIGVLNWDLQDLQNSQTLEPTAEHTVTKDKQEEFTYFSKSKSLVTQTLSLEWRNEALYQEFRDFFQWHGVSREFIFIDKARSRLLLNPIFGLAANEMLAKFTGAWSDNPIGAFLYGMKVDLRQTVDSSGIPPIA